MPSIAIPVSLRGQLLSGARQTLAGILFSANEPGFTFEPWDITTLFQDRAGTIPVTGAGQSVGYRRDKSGRGNHQVAVSDAKRGVYGWMPKTGRRNLLTYTEQFDNAAWTKSFANTVADSTNNPNGVATGDTVRLNAGTSLITPALGLFTNAAPYVSEPTSSSLTAAAHTYSLYVKGGVGLTHVQLRVGTTATLNPAVSSMVVRLSDGVVIDGVGTVTNIGAGWFRVSMPFTASAAVHHCGIWFWNSTSIASAAGTEGIYVWGAQLEVGSTATAYQRVASQYDITEAGVPTCYYVQADGVDDAYVTPTITPNTDKVQVFAGVRKLGNGMHIEHSASADANNGAFYRYAGEVAAGDLSVGLRGTQLTKLISAGAAIPVNRVETSLLDIAAATRETEILLRINGASVSGGAFGAADAGTGNFLAYPAYIYGRAGTSLPFNGLDFGHAVRFGPNLDAATIARVEALIARNTPEVTL